MGTDGSPAGAGTPGSVGRPLAVAPGDLFSLLKPRVMSLVTFTALVGLSLSPDPVHPVTGAAIILAIAAGAGASAAFNMAFDADIDAQMARTRSRPIPSGRVDVDDALALAGLLTGLSVLVLALASNWQAALLLAFTIFFYAQVYTRWLKRRTSQNIVIGGLAGALPPLIGYVAACGSLGWLPALLVALIFVWTPAHFWSLALCRWREYKTAGIPMLPVVVGIGPTSRAIAAYTALTIVIAGFFGWIADLSLAYGVVWAATSAWMSVVVVRLNRAVGTERLEPCAKTCFRASNGYLLAIFLAILVDTAAAESLDAIGLIFGALS